jgi:hypothetical protein
MGFNIPNAPLASVIDQSEPDSADFKALGNRDTGVSYGCVVTANTTNDQTVLVSDGEVISNGNFFKITSGGGSTQLSLGAGVSGSARFDIVVVTASGVLTHRSGGASTNPTFPVLEDGDVFLAAVYRASGTGDVISSTRIIDKRVITPTNMVRSGNGTPYDLPGLGAEGGNIGDLYVNTTVSSISGQSQLWVKTTSLLWENLAEFTFPESSLATGNTLVKRDASGNFAAGTITATFAGNGSAITNLASANLSGTIPSNVLGNSNVFIGTTAIPLNRTSATQTLNGVNISGSATSADNATRIGGRTVFTQNATPTANAVGDIWFQVAGL